ncbi:hypothetical protein BCR35DRAFT_331104 [Leucosporidium creatinivorum]|uniref:Uncharacterized protein n=1 Tax=Leucosporidium creatinivorum TaxID=106004 RepID=A0A1Y2FJQ3_9BASI|nr:hypothetical protein BCR35DRAFT_331104 [Leucosporidium creatinivorum]
MPPRVHPSAILPAHHVLPPAADASTLSNAITAAVALDEALVAQKIPYAIVGGVAIAALLGIAVDVEKHHTVFHGTRLPARLGDPIDFITYTFARVTKDLDFDWLLATRANPLNIWQTVHGLGLLPSPSLHGQVVGHAGQVTAHAQGQFHASAGGPNGVTVHWVPQAGHGIACDVHPQTRLAGLLNFEHVNSLYAPGNHLIRRVPVADLHHNVLGHINVWQPWLLLLLKLAAWAGRTAGAEKDLLDCRMLLEASAHGQNLGLTVAELHRHWEHSLSDAGKAVLGRVRLRIGMRMEVPRLIQHMNQWEQPFVLGRAGGFGDHALDPNVARRAGIARWQTFFNTMDQILEPIPMPATVHSLAKTPDLSHSPFFPRARGAQRVVVERWYL